VFNKTGKVFVSFILTCVLNAGVFAEVVSNPCEGPSAMLGIVDRPNAADSACVVPAKHIEIESGYQNQQLSFGGTQQDFPSPEIRFGLPKSNELFVLLPNYIHQTIRPSSGFSQTVAGLKHQFEYKNNWLVAVEGLVSLPDGSQAFGNAKLGEGFNAIFNYSLTSELSWTLMIGASSLAESRLAGGQRYNSVNPIFVLSYAPVDKINIYGEIFGQSKTGVGQGSGFNADAGILYLVRPNLVIDFSAGQRISGAYNDFEHYVGAGLSVIL
jgi:hypothetical protein